MPRRAELDERVRRFMVDRERSLNEERRAASRASTNLVLFVFAVGAGGITMAALLAWLVARRLDQLYEREGTATRRAEAAVATRDEMLGVVAHDLRSPLSAMIMKAALMRAAGPDDRTRKAAASIENVGMRMEFLIRSLLDAATLEAGKFSIVRAECAVSELLEGSLELFAGLAERSSVGLHCRVSPPALTISCDRERIAQVLANLVGNAIKFTPKGGTVHVEVTASDRNVRFEVRDTGRGIAPEHLAHLFDRHWQGDARDRRGAGLGLYIAKGIVAAHGGRIRASSTAGQGSAFVFEIPPEAPAPSEPPALADLSHHEPWPAH